MNLKFKHKVFLAFLLNGLVVVISVILIGRYYAVRNFKEYVGKMEMEKLDELADALSREYPKSGNWTTVLDDWDLWLQANIFGRGKSPESFKGDTQSFPPPPPMPFLLMWKDSKEGKPEKPGEPNRFPPPPDAPPGESGLHPPGPPPGHHALSSLIALFDPDKRPLTKTFSSASSAANDYRMKPVIVEGKLVGWVGIRPPGPLDRPLDVEFIRQQSQTLYSIGGVALLLAVLVTLLLSRHLLVPLKELAEGTRALTNRRFEARIEIRSGDEFGQLAEDFNAMARALERYEQMRRQWIADISHELRTPLAVLRAEIEAMQDGVREITREALDSLHFEVQHVIRIVHDLHDLSLIESRAFDSGQTAVNPLKVLEETLRSFHTSFENTGILVDVNGAGSSDITIMADADRLKQLFSNLLENTLRYAHAPGILKIECEHTPDHLFLYFEDSGPGVPEESLGRLFDRLYRVDKARSRSHGGSGLGLAICKSIVECFGGRIGASNALSGGLKITMAFPWTRMDTNKHR